MKSPRRSYFFLLVTLINLICFLCPEFPMQSSLYFSSVWTAWPTSWSRLRLHLLVDDPSLSLFLRENRLNHILIIVFTCFSLLMTPLCLCSSGRTEWPTSWSSSSSACPLWWPPSWGLSPCPCCSESSSTWASPPCRVFSSSTGSCCYSCPSSTSPTTPSCDRWDQKNSYGHGKNVLRTYTVD